MSKANKRAQRRRLRTTTILELSGVLRSRCAAEFSDDTVSRFMAAKAYDRLPVHKPALYLLIENRELKADRPKVDRSHRAAANGATIV